MALGVFRQHVEEQGLEHVIGADSAGTHAYRAGEHPDPRARVAAAKRGYDIGKIKARKVEAADFLKFNYLLAMDKENQQDLLERCEEKQKSKVQLLLDFAVNVRATEISDPYYGRLDDFETALYLIEEASHGLLEHVVKVRYLTPPQSKVTLG